MIPLINLYREIRARKWAWLPCLAFMISMALTTSLGPAPDFEVYWNSAHAILTGSAVYSLSKFGNMVIKYPPWMLPLFLPFGAPPLCIGKIAWGLLEALCLLVAVRWLLRQGIRDWVVGLLILLFAGVWTVHAYLGQVAIILLAVGALAAPTIARASRGPFFQLFCWVFSIKLLTLFPLMGARLSRRDWKAVPITALLWMLLTLPALLSLPEKNPASLARTWLASARSGSQVVNGVKVTIRGREAQGFPSFVFRSLDLDESDTPLVAFVCLSSAILLAAAWFALSRNLSFEERWVGWLALTPTVQPLAGFYFFCLAFPLAAFTLERAVRRRDPGAVGLALLGAVLISAVTRKTLGDAGAWMEAVSIKSFGVLWTAGVLIWLKTPETVAIASPAQ